MTCLACGPLLCVVPEPSPRAGLEEGRPAGRTPDDGERECRVCGKVLARPDRRKIRSGGWLGSLDSTRCGPVGGRLGWGGMDWAGMRWAGLGWERSEPERSDRPAAVHDEDLAGHQRRDVGQEDDRVGDVIG